MGINQLGSIHTIFVGDSSHPEFREARASLGAASECRTPDEGVELLRVTPAELVVLAQTRRNEFAAAAVERLRGVCPTAIPVNLLGSWCEGEVRSGRPYPGWNRVLWYRWPLEWARFLAGDPARWSLAAAGTTSELLQQRMLRVAGGRCRTIGLIGRQASRLETLQQVLKAWGHTVVPWENGERERWEGTLTPDSCLVAADALDPWLRRVVLQLRRYRRLELLVILLNFPRLGEVEWLWRQGGPRLQIVGQPFELAELQAVVGGAGSEFWQRKRRTA